MNDEYIPKIKDYKEFYKRKELFKFYSSIVLSLLGVFLIAIVFCISLINLINNVFKAPIGDAMISIMMIVVFGDWLMRWWAEKLEDISLKEERMIKLGKRRMKQYARKKESATD